MGRIFGVEFLRIALFYTYTKIAHSRRRGVSGAGQNGKTAGDGSHPVARRLALRTNRPLISPSYLGADRVVDSGRTAARCAVLFVGLAERRPSVLRHSAPGREESLRAGILSRSRL